MIDKVTFLQKNGLHFLSSIVRYCKYIILVSKQSNPDTKKTVTKFSIAMYSSKAIAIDICILQTFVTENIRAKDKSHETYWVGDAAKRKLKQLLCWFLKYFENLNFRLCFR